MTRSSIRPIAALAVLLIGLFGFGPASFGHALQPGYLELRLIDENVYAVVWKVPITGDRPMAITARLPEHCDQRTPGQPSWDGTAYVSRWTATCPDGLEGGQIHIDGLDKTSTDVLVRFDFVTGDTHSHRLTAADTSFIVPAQPSGFEVVQTYFPLGVEHILGGIDHLLFVLALLILVKGTRRIVVTVTAFTIAHSFTLAGATLGFVNLSGPPVEAAIALSIAFVASEIVHSREGKPGLAERYPWIVAFAFGLLHGFGFAGALTEIGLPQNAIPLALLFFNLGVEAGQLLFVAVVLIAVWAARQILQRISVPRPGWAWAIPPYAIGSIAAFWVIERVAAF